MQSIRGGFPIVFAACFLAGALASAQEVQTGECLPKCRSGFICIKGSCVSACNPPCANDEKCTPEGDCVPKTELSATTTPSLPSPGQPQELNQLVILTKAPPSSIVDDQLEVEGKLGRQLKEQHSNWLSSKTTRFPRFSDYMYQYYRGKWRRGVVFAAAIGVPIFVVGGVVGGTLFGLGKSATSDCGRLGDSDDREWVECYKKDDPYIIGGAVVMGVMGATGLAFIITGSVMANRNKHLMDTISGMQNVGLKYPRLQFVGFAPFIDTESKANGVSIKCKF